MSARCCTTWRTCVNWMIDEQRQSTSLSSVSHGDRWLRLRQAVHWPDIQQPRIDSKTRRRGNTPAVVVSSSTPRRSRARRRSRVRIRLTPARKFGGFQVHAWSVLNLSLCNYAACREVKLINRPMTCSDELFFVLIPNRLFSIVLIVVPTPCEFEKWRLVIINHL